MTHHAFSSGPGRIVDIDQTPPDLSQKDWADATKAVQDQVSPNYDLAITPGSQQQVTVQVPEEDLSPSWEELLAHCQEVLATLPSYDSPSLPDFPDDAEADLRLIPIRRKGQGDAEPNSVLISMKTGTVVSFNQSEPLPPEPESEPEPPEVRGLMRRMTTRIGTLFRRAR